MIRKAYSFLARCTCSSSGYEVDALSVFFDSKRPATEFDFFDELERSLRENETLPDCIVVISDTNHTESLVEHWTSSTQNRQTFLDRGLNKGVPFVKDVIFVAWSPTDGLSQRAHDADGHTSTIQLPLEDLVGKGLAALVRSNPVVQVAPAGHVFKHPSRTVNKLFIQARELATSEAELAFLGRCLTLTSPELAASSLARVFIDTMGVYSIVREALAFAESNARIDSYHSYGRLADLSPPTEPYVVVISASTSGGMAKTLCDEQGFEAERLVTLIDSSRENRSGKVLVALDKVDPSYGKHLTDGSETQIELFGEHFTSKAKPPRAVTLGVPHTPRALGVFLKHFGIGGLRELNAHCTTRRVTRLMILDGSAVGRNDQLLKWLDAEIDWSVGSAVDHIISANDAGSRALADHAANRLHNTKDCKQRPSVTCYDDLGPTTLESARGVLVVQAVAGDGGLLREISRDLREFLKPSVPRHFLIGVGMPQTAETWLRLRQFLIKNASNREYGFSCWLELPVGADGTANAWHTFNNLATNAQVESPTIDGVASDVANASVDLAADLVKNAFNGFLPTSSGAPLSLSDGFVFFGKSFDDRRLDEITTSTTFATVASVLQAARDLSNPANQLRSSGYESVVLSPENFLRYNDNLLQACILRAAHPSELDYSSSPDLSRLMKEFLLKVFERHAHPYGAASLEFAAALATGRLRLSTDDSRELQARSLQNLAAAPSALVGLLCLMGSLGR
ncbi:hypothetical protein [Cupriavidus consociatus]|uniref:hypothetical protein n=1 Tax=Cupriavidus consociatus TaxID=2821357 RepID=UPI001AE73145|nr:MULTISPECIES: hypothetical protein [unclassified Cupriavidus]MBP0621140.1 hypothetical protein [Cupriavidus sp. LEh25]MDK2657810.1 hypothetical protein [Cupriavidus sp. LEh21]